MQYTVFEYMYRDAANYKAHGCLWLQGTLADEEIAGFPALLETDEFFIAEQVGVPALQSQRDSFGEPSSDDHVWHTFVGFRSEEDLQSGQKLHATCGEFIRRFKVVRGDWQMERSEAYATY